MRWGSHLKIFPPCSSSHPEVRDAVAAGKGQSLKALCAFRGVAALAVEVVAIQQAFSWTQVADLKAFCEEYGLDTAGIFWLEQSGHLVTLGPWDCALLFGVKRCSEKTSRVRQAGQKADLIERVSKAPREKGKRVPSRRATCLIAGVDLSCACLQVESLLSFRVAKLAFS